MRFSYKARWVYQAVGNTNNAILIKQNSEHRRHSFLSNFFVPLQTVVVVLLTFTLLFCNASIEPDVENEQNPGIIPTSSSQQEAEIMSLNKEEDSETLPSLPAPSKADQLYGKALQIRDSASSSDKELKRAVDLLYAAAGIEHLSVERRQRPSVNTSSTNMMMMHDDIDDDGDGNFITAADVKIVWKNNSIQHVKAVRELIFVFRGDGAPLNPAIAHRLLLELAEHGDMKAQADVGFFLAQGIEPVAPNSQNQLFRLRTPDIPAALVYYYFAAKAGDPVAQLAMGYRYFYGHGVPKSCHTSALYYVSVADRVLELAQLPDTLPQIRQLRLSHKTAAAYRSRPSVEQEFLHYQWFADYGHADAARAVAHLLSHGVERDHAAAVQYLLRAADAGDADAMAHLGHMHANGLAVDQDNSTAWRWFWRAAERGHASGFFGLGFLHLTGQGADVDHKQAFSYFNQAVEAGGEWSGLGDALFFLGTMHLKGLGTPLDINQAVAMFNAASMSGNLLAAYNLAVLHLRGMAGEAKGPASCRAAVSQLKRIAERAWPALAEANDDFAQGDYDWALLNYLKAAEWGSEIGQSNAAWMLTEGYGYEGALAGAAAVELFRKAAEQGNSAALVRLGDSYWYGKGVPRNWGRAGRAYAQAAHHRIPQALFNLGFMHQHGAGIAKDVHLAKRYYDRAATAAEDAWLAVSLALASLKVQVWWEGMEHKLPASLSAVVRGAVAFQHRLGLGIVVVEPGTSSSSNGGSSSGSLMNGTTPSTAIGNRIGSFSGGSGEGGGVIAGRGMRGPLGRLRRVFSLSTLVNILDALDSSFDYVSLIWVAGLLVLVLWRRQMLRARAHRYEHHQEQQPPAVGAVVGGVAAVGGGAAAAAEEEEQIPRVAIPSGVHAEVQPPAVEDAEADIVEEIVDDTVEEVEETAEAAPLVATAVVDSVDDDDEQHGVAAEHVLNDSCE